MLADWQPRPPAALARIERATRAIGFDMASDAMNLEGELR